MADMLLDRTQKDFNGMPIWDIIEEDGVAVEVSGEQEEIQNAEVACFLTLGSTPQLPNDGVDHVGFFSDLVSFGEYDTQIKDNIAKTNLSNYYPDYNIVNNKLNIQVKRG